MGNYKLETSQVVHASLETCWNFFSSPKNLCKITPPSLDFVIKSDLPEKMYAGMMIEYRVRPMLGIPVSWLTEITYIEEGKFFADEQRVGPYAIWHHEHFFEEITPDQVMMRDRIHYRLPLSPLSDIIHPFIVKPQLDAIFSFRQKAVDELFPAPQ